MDLDGKVKCPTFLFGVGLMMIFMCYDGVIYSTVPFTLKNLTYNQTYTKKREELSQD